MGSFTFALAYLDMHDSAPYQPNNKIRIVTAASLFDGHDAAINIMRRIIQSTGCEVIHLGHDRSVDEVVNTAIEEDAQAIAMTSYQGGHMEYFKYMFDLLKERGAGHIKIFGGGGGTILPDEIQELHAYGITRIYHPDDGRAMGLQGMINDLVSKCDFPTGKNVALNLNEIQTDQKTGIAQLISAAENFPQEHAELLEQVRDQASKKSTPVLGITGTGGAGKSSMVDELVRRFLLHFPDKTIGIISVDPSKKKTGGALLGDRTDEFHPQPTGVYALTRNATKQPCTQQACCGGCGYSESGWLRLDCTRNFRDRTKRHRNHGPQ